VPQEERVLAFNTVLRDSLRDSSKEVAAHLEAATRADCSSFIRTATEGEHFGEAAVRAVIRHRTRARHQQLPPVIRCPGCNHPFDVLDWQNHVMGCASCRGFNATKRHHAVNNAIKAAAKSCGVTFDDQEPREFSSYHCPGCRTVLDDERTADAHISTCPRLSTAKKLTAASRRSGPDGRLYLGESNVVYDVTIVSPTAPSYVRRGVHAAFADRIADKHKRYKKRVEDVTAQQFAVIGGTAFGELCGDTVALLRRLSARSEGEVLVADLRRRISTAIVFASGQILASMEARKGVLHTPSPFQTILNKLGRKVDAAAHSL